MDKNFIRYIIVFIIGTIIGILIFVIPFISLPNNEESLNLAIVRTVLNVITIPIIVVGFYFTTIQLRKSTAKPKIEAVFTENGTSENTITAIKDLSYKEEYIHELELSIINNGNVIARFFQIEFFVPHIYRPRIAPYSQLRHGPLPPKFDISEKFQKLSLYNDGDIVFFVKKPVKICTLLIGTFTEKHEQYPKEFIIDYRVYGDWEKPQEGKLKVIINKQEVTHDPTTG